MSVPDGAATAGGDARAGRDATPGAPATAVPAVPRAGYTVHVSADPYPSGVRRLLSYRLGDVYLHVSAPAATPQATGAPVVATSWEAVVEALLPSRVVDHRPHGTVRPRDAAFEHLYPVLAPGGTYVFEDARSAPGHLRAPDGASDEASPASPGMPAALVAFCARTLATVREQDGSRELTKKSFDQRILRERPASDLAPSAPVVAPESYPRVVPTIVDDGAGEDRLSRLTGGFEDQSPPVGTLSLFRDVRVIGYGTIVTDDRYVVSESMVHNHHQQQRGMLFRVGASAVHVAENPLLPPGTPPIEGDCVVLKQNWDANYGHWLVDTLPRVLSVAPHYDLGAVRFLLNPPPNDAMRDVCTRSMVLAGAREENLVFDGSHPRTVDHAIYPSPISDAPLVKHPAAIRFLRGFTAAPQVAAATDHAPHGRIYLSRNGFGKREMLNEDQLLPLLLDAGYVVVHPEQLSFLDQVATFADATHVVGNMGAAFANLVFAAEGVHTLCIGTELMQHDYFYDIVCLKGGTYTGMNGPATHRERGLASDFTVDTEAFRKVATHAGLL